MAVGIIIDPDGEEKRKKAKREALLASAGLRPRVSYNGGKTGFRPFDRMRSEFGKTLGVDAEKEILRQIVDCFGGNADLAIKFISSRNDLVKALAEAQENKRSIDEFQREYEAAVAGKAREKIG